MNAPELDSFLLELESSELLRSNDPEYCQFLYEEAIRNRLLTCVKCGSVKPKTEFSKYNYNWLGYIESTGATCNQCYQNSVDRSKYYDARSNV